MKYFLILLSIVSLVSCSSHRYYKDSNIGVLDVVKQKKSLIGNSSTVITSFENENELELYYAYKELSAVQYKKFNKRFDEKSKVKKTKKEKEEKKEVLFNFRIGIKDKLSLIEQINHVELKKYLIENTDAKLITKVVYCVHKALIDKLNVSKRVTLVTENKTPYLKIYTQEDTELISLSDLVQLGYGLENFCIGNKRYREYEVIDILDKKEEKCLKQERIIPKKQIYTGV